MSATSLTEPSSPQALFETGMALHTAGRDQEAVPHLVRAGQIAPESAQVFHALGCALQKLKLYPQAVWAFERALQLKPRSNPICYHLGNACFQLDDISRATDFFRRAVEIQPDDFESWNNLGKCFKELNRLEESLAAYDRALRLKPDYALAHHGRALTLLAAGRWREGFAGYEWRGHPGAQRSLEGLPWRGEDLFGGTLFIHAEQGCGDAIQMARFLPQIRARAGKVILECQPELKTLFQHSNCANEVIAFGEAVPSFDFHLPMASLPQAIGFDGSEWPGSGLHSRAEENPTTRTGGKLRVGLVWAGNPQHQQDAQRSMPLAELVPLLNIPDIEFILLQQPVPERDAKTLAMCKDVVQKQPPFNDFLETADFIAALDLVITVDTAVAHLAGALGKPVWVLLQHSPDWRWQLDRTDTPWYPTMRLFRQSVRNDWHEPVARMVAGLQTLTV